MTAIIESDANIRAAVEVEKMFTQDEIARRAYEKAEKFRRDQAAQLHYAVSQGIERGIKQGIERGNERGIESMIAALRELDISEDTIAEKLREHYELSPDEIKRYMALH